nr:uncharacterized protein LOC115263737 [Aedes albopictus]
MSWNRQTKKNSEGPTIAEVRQLSLWLPGILKRLKRKEVSVQIGVVIGVVGDRHEVVAVQDEEEEVPTKECCGYSAAVAAGGAVVLIINHLRAQMPAKHVTRVDEWVISLGCVRQMAKEFRTDRGNDQLIRRIEAYRGRLRLSKTQEWMKRLLTRNRFPR